MAITRFKHLVATALLTTLAGVSNATTVLIETSAGEIVVNLYDEATPATVTNFLSYVTDGSYNDGLFHRLVPGFIVQSGGLYFTDPTDVDSVQTITSKGTVVNEPVYSSVEGTIAMAKLGGDPDSATSEWFINIADNSCNLDLQNGGFTVFGQVISGMEFMTTIAASTATTEDYVAINAITILDGAVDTSASLVSTPVLNTLISGSGENSSSCDSASNGDGGGGAPSGGFLILMLSLLGLGRRTK
mgnify:CR=1 FL=1